MERFGLYQRQLGLFAYVLAQQVGLGRRLMELYDYVDRSFRLHALQVRRDLPSCESSLGFVRLLGSKCWALVGVLKMRDRLQSACRRYRPAGG